MSISRPQYTKEDVKTHDQPSDLWMIIHNKVYDVTSFAKDHPGGVEVLFDCGGVDASEAFDDVAHSDDAVHMLEPLYIGDVMVNQRKAYFKKLPPKSIVKKKKVKKGMKRCEKSIIWGLITLAFLAFAGCIFLQRMKWESLLSDFLLHDFLMG